MKKSLSNQELKWVDTHCHLQLLKHKISEIDFSNIEYLIIPGVDVDSSKKAKDASSSLHIKGYWSAGLHPHDAKKLSTEKEELDVLFSEADLIGETGLDFYRNFSTPEQQQVSFEAHIEAAIDNKVPLFLHEREAHEKFVEVITPYMKELPESVVHCFTGDKDALLKYIDMGFFIGITGWICDERRGKHLESLIPLIPLEKLMIETDAPYLLPRDMGIDNSSRNEPKYLPHIAKRIAELRGESVELVFSAIYMNSLNFFNIS